MKNIFKIEIKKAIHNRFFFVAVTLGCAITLLSTFYTVPAHFSFCREPYAAEFQEMSTLYNAWIGGDYQSLGTSLYYFLFPLLVALPYGWSYCEEKQEKYCQKVVVKAGRQSYMAAKYTAAFLSGGLAMILPLCFNLVITAMFVPAIRPYVLNDIYYAVFGGSLMADLFYTHPFLRIVIYLVIDFIYCGLLSCLCIAAASLIHYRLVCLVVPELICLGVHFGRQLIYVDPVIYREISPFFILKACDTVLCTNWTIIIGEIVFLFMISLLAGILEYRRDYV